MNATDGQEEGGGDKNASWDDTVVNEEARPRADHQKYEGDKLFQYGR